jgi:hypothetical protein
VSRVSEAQQYPTDFKVVCPATISSGISYCTVHQYTNPVSIGGVSGADNGFQWQAVRPSGAVIASGNFVGNAPSASLPNGTLYRLRSDGNYFGFKFKGPWATTPVRIYSGGTSSSHSCRELYPLEVRDLTVDILTYEGPNRILSTGSALYLPQKTTIYVKTSEGTGIQGLPVEVWSYRKDNDDINDNNHSLVKINTETFSTDSSGKVQYRVPDRFDRTDHAGVIIPTDYDEKYMDTVNGEFRTHYKGFNHAVSIPLTNVSSGGTKTITVPDLSTATIERLGSTQSNRTVYVVNSGITGIISDSVITTDSTGKASYAIPDGTQFRFYVDTTDGAYYTNVLTAPSNGHIRIVAQNTPALTTPASGASFSDAAVVNFSWATVSNASDYVWYIRPSNQSNYSGYIFSSAGVGAQFGAGTWYWVVQARDANANVIAQSEIRSFTVVASSSSTSSQTSASQGASSRLQATATPSMTLQSNYTAIHNGQPELENSSTSFAQLIDELENEESLDWLRTLFFPFSN